MGTPGLGRGEAAAIAGCNNAGAILSARERTAAIAAQLPSFFVLGPPRTGTSWLHHVLQRHANLPSPTKETRFFDSHFHRGLPWYLAHFPAASAELPRGEIAPTYFASVEARDRIAHAIPGAKLIFIFRNPIERLVSLYRTKRAYGLLPWTLEEALQRDPELLDSARYATFLRRWQAAFPEPQLLITLYDDLRDSPQTYLDRVFEFMEVPGGRLTPAELARKHASERLTQPRSFLLTRTATAFADWCKAHRMDNLVASVRDSRLIRLFLGGGAPFPELPLSTIDRLSQLLLPEVEALQQMTGRDLSMWKTSHGDGSGTLRSSAQAW